MQRRCGSGPCLQVGPDPVAAVQTEPEIDDVATERDLQVVRLDLEWALRQCVQPSLYDEPQYVALRDPGTVLVRFHGRLGSAGDVKARGDAREAVAQPAVHAHDRVEAAEEQVAERTGDENGTGETLHAVAVAFEQASNRPRGEPLH